MPARPPLFKTPLSTLPCLVLLPLAALCATAQAGVMLKNTRIVFPATDQEVTVELGNEGQQPELVQAWLDQETGTGQPGDSSALFAVSPALFRMEPGKGQMLRILRSRQPLPTDRESLFWLHVLEVPHKPKAGEAPGALRFAFSTRIKMMYRPPGLPGNAQAAPASLQWTLAQGRDGQPALQATNPTAYVVNLGGVDLKTGTTVLEAGAGHVLPGETASFPVQGAGGRALAGGTVVFHSLNDWGASTAHEAHLSP